MKIGRESPLNLYTKIKDFIGILLPFFLPSVKVQDLGIRTVHREGTKKGRISALPNDLSGPFC